MTLKVERLDCSTDLVSYYRVSRGKEGGPPVTVRRRGHGVAACLTCLTTMCPHVMAVLNADPKESLLGSSQGPKEGV